MAVDRSIIGLVSSPVIYDVERGAIRKFAEAIGDTTPECLRGDVAPPSFPTTLRAKQPHGMVGDMKRILHGGEEYEYFRPIKAGDRISVTRRVTDVYEREGKTGTMAFFLYENEGTDEAGQVVFLGRTTIILR